MMIHCTCRFIADANSGFLHQKSLHLHNCRRIVGLMAAAARPYPVVH